MSNPTLPNLPSLDTAHYRLAMYGCNECQRLILELLAHVQHLETELAEIFPHLASLRHAAPVNGEVQR